MRILFCNYEYPPVGGGGGVINALLAEELAARHEVTVLTSQGLGLPREDVQGGVSIVRVPVFFRRQQAAANLPSLLAYLPMGALGGRRVLRERRFDVVNTHFVLPSGPVGQAVARRGRLPNVLSVHGGDLYDPSKWTSPHRHALLRAWVRRLLRQADRVVGQSRNTVENIHRFYAPELQPLSIPLGIRRPPLVEARRADYGYGPDDRLMVTVGRLVGRKAVDQLLHVLAELGDSRVRLMVIGSGPQLAPLQQQAQEMGLSEQVRFWGQVDEAEKHRLLSIADLFASTSQHEGFGLVFLEALAWGLPVVCYDHGGQSDFLATDRTGAVVALNDRAAFTAACRRLLSDDPLRLALGQRCQATAERYYIDNCARQYEALFEEVVERHQAAEAALGHTRRA